uniref:C-type lectin domain-containing protein n=1 Tax=Poecilia reticulata TaxID=8081 RepID=A0A3P9NM83_POERE
MERKRIHVTKINVKAKRQKKNHYSFSKGHTTPLNDNISINVNYPLISYILLLLTGPAASCPHSKQRPLEKTWKEAQQYCRENHTDLATVNNMKDMEGLISISLRGINEAWIGLYDQTNAERSWHWSLPEVEFNKKVPSFLNETFCSIRCSTHLAHYSVLLIYLPH